MPEDSSQKLSHDAISSQDKIQDKCWKLSAFFAFPACEVLKQPYLQSDHTTSTHAISYADQEDKDTIPASINIRSTFQLHSKQKGVRLCVLGKYLEITFWAHYYVYNKFLKYIFIDICSQLLPSKRSLVGCFGVLGKRNLDACIVNCTDRFCFVFCVLVANSFYDKVRTSHLAK